MRARMTIEKGALLHEIATPISIDRHFFNNDSDSLVLDPRRTFANAKTTRMTKGKC